MQIPVHFNSISYSSGTASSENKEALESTIKTNTKGFNPPLQQRNDNVFTQKTNPLVSRLHLDGIAQEGS